MPAYYPVFLNLEGKRCVIIGGGTIAEGKISNESPVGLALLGRNVGDVVEVAVPAGVQRLTLVEIS